nr:MAG TPA: hypothetical protein [Caudoviricetes sp.]
MRKLLLYTRVLRGSYTQNGDLNYFNYLRR